MAKADEFVIQFDNAWERKRLAEYFAFHVAPPDTPKTKRVIEVDKRTHRIRFEDETEEFVRIVVESKHQGEGVGDD